MHSISINCFFILILSSFYIINTIDKAKSIKIIIISCPKDGVTINLNISLLPFRVDVIKCNKNTNSYDGREAGLMLDYIIYHYNRISYSTFLFLHDHDKSSHYTTSITNRINKIYKEKYIYHSDYIGINCFYYNARYWNKHSTFHIAEVVEKYLSENNIEHVKLSLICQKLSSFFFTKKSITYH